MLPQDIAIEVVSNLNTPFELSNEVVIKVELAPSGL
jgi:hypothetical protein